MICHHQLQDTYVDLCHSAHLGVKIEAGSDLTPDVSLSCLPMLIGQDGLDCDILSDSFVSI